MQSFERLEMKKVRKITIIVYLNQLVSLKQILTLIYLLDLSVSSEKMLIVFRYFSLFFFIAKILLIKFLSFFLKIK
jgi:hypothetical protein